MTASDEGSLEPAGLGWPYDAIRRRNAQERLAAELGLRLPIDRRVIKQLRRRWTDHAIDAALDAMLAGRDSWSTKNEFREAGLAGLYKCLHRTDSRDTWARRYRLAVQGQGTSRA